MAPIFKVAVIQLYPKPMQAANNFSKAAGFIRGAAAQGCNLAVLPEYHLTNFLPNDPKFPELCAQWEYYLHEYQALAKELKICIVPGTLVQTPPSRSAASNEPSSSQQLQGQAAVQGRPKGEGYENVTYFISDDGSILGRYAKKNLWGPTERNYITSSTREPHVAFDTPLGKVGLLICWDLAFPEAFRELIAQGAKTIIIPTFWTLNDCSEAGLKQNPCAEALFIDSTLTSRTFENTCAIVFSNAGGPTGRGYMGLSQVAVPFVGSLTRLGGCAEGMAIADIDMQVMEDAEANYCVRSDIDSGIWHYDYRPLSSTKVEGRGESGNEGYGSKL